MGASLDKKQSDIRRAQKEALFFRELSQFFLRVTLDNPNLIGVHINSVKLSPDKSVCTIYFYSDKGEEDFREKLSELILYKPSLRKALSQAIPSRYTPQLVFKYDAQFEKQQKLEKLFDDLKQEGKL